MARKLEVEILGNEKDVLRAFGRTQRGAQKLNLGLGQLAKAAGIFTLVDKGIGAIGGAFSTASREFTSMAKEAATTQAVLKSTGGVANVTAKHVDELSKAVLDYSGIDDEAVKHAENLLLTFKEIRNETGKNNDIFDRATKAAVDLSQAGFGDLSSTAKQLGKALNDPIKGVTALRRAGVQLTAGQTKQIKALVETGHILEAQKIVLKEVESQVGGTAKAIGDTVPGQLNKLKESFNNTLGEIAGAVSKPLAGALGQVNKFFQDIGAARTIRLKAQVALDRLEGLATSLTSRLADAVHSVDWNKVWGQARGVADGLQKKLDSVNFTSVGKSIGNGISSATKDILPAAKKIADRINKAVKSIDFVKMGKAIGPGLAAAIVTAFVTLTDPSFWIHNWDLALAVAAVAFKVPILKLGGKLVGPLVRIGGEVVGKFVRAVVDKAPRFAEAMLRVAAVGLSAIARGLGALDKVVSKQFGRLGKIAKFTIKVLGIQAAINAVVGFGRSMVKVFDTAFDAVKAGVLKAILFVTEKLDGVKIFGHRLIPGAHSARKAIEAELAKIKVPEATLGPGDGSSKGKTWGAAFVSSAQSLLGGLPAIFNPLAGLDTSHLAGAAKDLHTFDSVLDHHVNTTTKAARAASRITPDIRNQIFDAGITSSLNQAGNASASEQVSMLTKVAASLTAQIAKVKDITRKTTLRDKLLEVQGQLKSARQQAGADALDTISLGLDKAQLTKTLTDDLAAVNAELKGVQQQIAIQGRTNDLERQRLTLLGQRRDLLEQQKQAAQAAAQAAKEARNARQFRALGLASDGSDVIPGIKGLRKQLGNVDQAIQGTFLDTKKTKGLLGRIRKVLSGGLGDVSRDVRSKVASMLADLDQQLKDHNTGPATKSQLLDTSKALSGLNLTGDQLRQAAARLGGAVVPVTARGATGIRTGDIHVTSEVVLDGKVVARSTKKHLDRRSQRNAPTRRGLRGGQ